MNRIHVSVCAMLLLITGDLHARGDTLFIDMADAERRFLAGNLHLLAARFNLDAARAAVVQARLWSNPNVQIEQNVYNQLTKRYFDITKTGNTDVQIQQLFLLAGKRDKQIRLAEINTEIAEHSLYEILRALRLELRCDFYDLFFLQQSLSFYDESLRLLRNTVTGVERVYAKRSILLGEVLRLKALLFSLVNERLALLNRAEEVQGGLRLLLRDTSRAHVFYVPLVRSGSLDSVTVDSRGLDQLIAEARERRPDFKIAGATVAFEETNLALQHALAVPDVTLGGLWSRAGSYIPDYFAVTVAVDLPLFNRNQGNILVSEKTLEADRANRDNIGRTVEKEVTVAFRRAVETDSAYRGFDRKFTGEYTTLVEGMVTNYLKRNMTVIEFTDFYESYRTAMLQMNQLQNDRVDAFEGLNYATGEDLFAGETR
jgi:cobalt-zinc-cadmium efflux system outer membrane protein